MKKGLRQLEQFLSHHRNSRTKEAILNHRLIYDLKVAAALNNYDLSLYSPDVDRDGFDIILDDRDTIRKIQVKTVFKDSTTSGLAAHEN